MNLKELNRKLNSVGKQVFVENYHLFKSFAHGEITRDQALTELVRLGISNEAGAALRINNAKPIFDAKQEMNAIAIILDSKRVSLTTQEIARKL